MIQFFFYFQSLKEKMKGIDQLMNSLFFPAIFKIETHNFMFLNFSYAKLFSLLFFISGYQKKSLILYPK